MLRGQMIPLPELLIREVSAHAVGCCVLEKHGKKRCLINAAIIEKNTPVPCSKTHRYRLEDDLQQKVIIEVLHGLTPAEAMVRKRPTEAVTY